MTIDDPKIVSAAIVAWTGKGVSSHPRRDERRVIAALGEKRASAVLPVVFELEREFYESDARHTTADLAMMGDVAAERFRRAHPELSDEALAALTWCYTFDHK